MVSSPALPPPTFHLGGNLIQGLGREEVLSQIVEENGKRCPVWDSSHSPRDLGKGCQGLPHREGHSS
jgi:hypothetical protein